LLRQLPYRNVEQVFWIWSEENARKRGVRMVGAIDRTSSGS